MIVMSYKLGQLPSAKATLSEIADFMEYQCLISDENVYSSVSGESAIGISCDDPNSMSDENSDFVDALAEIEDRNSFSCGKYPFETTTNSLTISAGIENGVLEVYKFLLLATRENMSENKIAAQIDGTALFERLCTLVLKNYFGEKCSSFVFGTGQQEVPSFSVRVQEMLDKLDEGNLKFRHPDCDSGQQKDGKLDVVVFIPFADNKKGQFIAFGQCKTGTNWRPAISQLNPKVFCQTYCVPPPGFIPIAVFMVTESFTQNWEMVQRSSNGILFDRTRIMNYLPGDIDTGLLEEIRQWNAAVIERYHRA